MKAARFHAREDVRIDDIPEPETTDGTVKIKVDWCGICGTDLHEYLEGPIFTPVAGSPHPLTGEVAPVQDRPRQRRWAVVEPQASGHSRSTRCLASSKNRRSTVV